MLLFGDAGTDTMSLSCAVFAVLYLATQVISTEVRVNQGLLKGRVREAVTGKCSYHSFQGIPYAQPPVGKLRFKAPDPPLPWSGTRDATKHGPVCTQYNFQAVTDSEKHIGEEDCLYLNVYSPDIGPKHLLSVVIYIHGGGFSSGSGNEDYYGPDFLVCKNVIVVTMNYRIGALGYLSMDTEDVPGNAGMKDQVATFRWVQENIQYFGGDPSKVTIMGQSAGSTSVGLHLFSPMSSGLFQRAILMSGVPMVDFATPFEPRSRAFALGKLLGCETRNTHDLLECLQRVPADKFMHMYDDIYPPVINMEKLWKNDIFKTHIFTPVMEVIGKDSFLRKTEECDTFTKIINKEPVNNVDILIGHTALETSFAVNNDYLKLYDNNPELLAPKQMFLALKPHEVLDLSKKIRDHYFNGKPINMDVVKEFTTYSSDINFVASIRKFMDLISVHSRDKLQNHNSRQYFYTFSTVSGRNIYSQGAAQYGLIGATHLDDTMYVFDSKKNNMTIEKNSREYQLIQMINGLFANFIKHGNPTPTPYQGVMWPEYDSESKLYVDINDTLTIRSDPDAATASFWNDIYYSVLGV